MAAADGNATFAVEFGALMLVAMSIYIIPSCVAFARRHPNRWLILVINIVAGGTGLGWLGALIWALNIGQIEPDLDSAADRGSTPRLLPSAVMDRRSVDVPSVAASATAKASLPLSAGAAVVELERLNGLKAGGHISEAEFATFKNGLLDRLSGKESA